MVYTTTYMGYTTIWLLGVILLFIILSNSCFFIIMILYIGTYLDYLLKTKTYLVWYYRLLVLIIPGKLIKKYYIKRRQLAIIINKSIRGSTYYRRTYFCISVDVPWVRKALLHCCIVGFSYLYTLFPTAHFYNITT